MSVILYKNGETTKVAPRSVQSHLDQGWSLQDPNRPPPGTPDNMQLPPGSTPQEYESAALQQMGITGPGSERVTPETYQKPSEVAQEPREQETTPTPPPKPKRKPGRPRKRKTE